MTNLPIRMALMVSAFSLTSLCGGATLTSLSYLAGGCVTTVVDGCAPIGLTAGGSLTNPFLNDLNTKAIDLSTGTYYTFSDPFFAQGDSVEIVATFTNNVTIDSTIVMPDLTTGANSILDVSQGGETLLLQTTGLGADRISFGYAPSSFQTDGIDDTILQLTFSEAPVVDPIPPAMSPEPASIGLIAVAGMAALLLRRRR